MEPLVTLFDEAAGELVPLPPDLSAVYGPLRMPRPRDRPYVFTNFVASLDGIVAVDPPRGTGADISGGDARDRAVMGLLRAVADAVVIGAGNLRAERDHVWTAARVSPELARSYAQLRVSLRKPPEPLQVVVTGSGDVDLSLPVFSGPAPSIVVSTATGSARLPARGAATRIAVVAPSPSGWIPLQAVLDAAAIGPGSRVLVESGPTSTARFLEERAIDELFLTSAPIVVGRWADPVTLGLVEGRLFRPGSLAARLLSLRRGGDFLFLRYVLGTA